MATAAVDTDSTSCGFCLQRVAYMEDPRELDCGHVYCMPCLESDYTKMGATDCVICGKTHSKENVLDFLPQYEARVPPTANEVPEKVIKCSFCEEKMVVFCIECDTKLCDSHAEYHEKSQEMFFKTKHPTVGADAYSSSPRKFEQRICETHTETKISKACSICYAVFCDQCDRKPCSNGLVHTEVDIRSLSGKIKQQYDGLLKEVASRVAKIGHADKQTWKRLEDKEVDVLALLAEVDKTTEEQLAEIKKDAEAVKVKITQTFGEDTQTVVTFTSKLIDQREELNCVWIGTKTHLSNDHDVDIIKEFRMREKQLKMEGECASGDDCSLSDIELKHHALSRQCELAVLVNPQSNKPPASLQFIKMNKPPGSTKSVCWLPSGNIVCGTGSCIFILDQELNTLKSTDGKNKINANGVCAMSDGTIVGLHQANPENKLVHYSKDLVWIEDVGTYKNSSNGLIHVTSVGDSIIAVDQTKRCLQIFKLGGCSFDRTVNMIANLKRPLGLHALDRNHVLVTDRDSGNVFQQNLATNEKNPVWTCEGLRQPSGLSCDDNGWIYVVSKTSDVIYVISQEGKLEKELPLGRNFKFIADISIQGDNLVVAGTSEGTALYKIVR